MTAAIETCAHCKQAGVVAHELIPFTVLNAKNHSVTKWLHGECSVPWFERYDAWRDGLTQKANGASNAASDDSNG